MNVNHAETNAVTDTVRTAEQGDDVETVLGHRALQGAGIGFGVGGFIGAVVAAIAAAVTSIALPGFGVLVAGPLAAAIIGAGAGAANGTLVGALIGWSIPQERVVIQPVAADVARALTRGMLHPVTRFA